MVPSSGQARGLAWRQLSCGRSWNSPACHCCLKLALALTLVQHRLLGPCCSCKPLNHFRCEPYKHTWWSASAASLAPLAPLASVAVVVWESAGGLAAALGSSCGRQV